MSDILSPEEAERLFKNWSEIGVMGEVAALLLARADGTLRTVDEWFDSLDLETFSSWVYKFTAPTGVITWDCLPQHRREAFVKKMSVEMNTALGDTKETDDDN